MSYIKSGYENRTDNLCLPNLPKGWQILRWNLHFNPFVTNLFILDALQRKERSLRKAESLKENVTDKPIDEAVWWMTDSEYAIWLDSQRLESQLGE